jgi:hypothetical protein
MRSIYLRKGEHFCNRYRRKNRNSKISRAMQHSKFEDWSIATIWEVPAQITNYYEKNKTLRLKEEEIIKMLTPPLNTKTKCWEDKPHVSQMRAYQIYDN